MFGNAVGNAIVAGRVQAADDELREKQLAQFSRDVVKPVGDYNKQTTNQMADNLDAQTNRDLNNFVSQQRVNENNDTQARFNRDEVTRANANSTVMQNSRSYNQGIALLENDRLSLVQEYGDIRAANKVAAQNRYDNMQTFKLKGAGGVDFANDFDWKEIGAFQEAAWADGRHRLNEFNNFSILPNEGGFTFSQGLQGTGEALIYGAAVTYGDFYSFSFKEKLMTVGKFGSVQGGKDIGVRPLALFGGDVVVDNTLYFDGGQFERSMEGPFTAFGGEASALFSISAEAVQAHQPDGSSKIDAIGVAIGVGAPDVSGHAHFGYGEIIGEPVRVPFSEVPSYFFHRWTYNVFK